MRFLPIANPEAIDAAVCRARCTGLFTFGDSIGTDYTGLWTDESTLIVSILNATGGTASTGSTRVRIRDRLGGLIFNAARNSEAASGDALLEGSFGSLAAPAIISFDLEDVDNADTVFGDGDTLTIVFDRRTDRGGAQAATRGAEAFVDSLFTFSHPIGDRFSGEWRDTSIFTVTIVNATNEGVTTDGVQLQPGGVRVTPTGLARPIRNRAQTSPPASATSPVLQLRNGGVGTAEPPRLVSFHAADPDGGDFSYGVGDTLTITFRGRSNKGAHAGGRAFVDSLFLMEPRLGADYSGYWSDGSVFVIDVIEASLALQDYSGAYQTIPVLLNDEAVVCPSFDRGAFADFPDVDREFVLALNGVDFVRTQVIMLPSQTSVMKCTTRYVCSFARRYHSSITLNLTISHRWRQ